MLSAIPLLTPDWRGAGASGLRDCAKAQLAARQFTTHTLTFFMSVPPRGWMASSQRGKMLPPILAGMGGEIEHAVRCFFVTGSGIFLGDVGVPRGHTPAARVGEWWGVGA